MAERGRKYREANREKEAERHRIYQAANRERINERNRELYNMNPEKSREKERKKMEALRQDPAKWAAHLEKQR